MELRRALLLFAIVLGMAAIAGSIANPPEDEEEAGPGRGQTQTAPTTAPRPDESPAARTATIRFPAAGQAERRTLEAGRPATLLVEVEDAGQVEIPSLGLDQPAEPLTPARFDVLVPEPGEHPIVLRPAAADSEQERIGVLEVREPR